MLTKSYDFLNVYEYEGKGFIPLMICILNGEGDANGASVCNFLFFCSKAFSSIYNKNQF